MKPKGMTRGGFAIGVVVGLLVGLSLALGVALYITKAPIPFINKVPPRTTEQDQAEAERNKNWDPNAPLAGRMPVRSGAPGGEAASAPPTAAAPGATPPSARDPAAILAGAPPVAPAPAPTAPRSTAPGADPFVYFVQVGAFSNPDEAEQQRAKLALAGHVARISEREQAGRTVYRVRLGPFERREEAEAAQAQLTQAGSDARLVRVERS